MEGTGDKPSVRELPPEKWSIADMQRGHTYGSKLPDKGPPPPPLEQRLHSHRRKLQASLDTTNNIALVPLGCLGWLVCILVFGFTGLILMEALGLGSSYAYGTEFAVIGIPLLATALLLVALYFPQRRLVWRIARSAYNSTWQAIQMTDVLLVIAQEDQHSYIRERIDGTFALKWISAPIPRTLEQHLEFAAAYFQTYLALSQQAEHTTGSTLVNGSLPWFAGQRACCVVGIVGAVFTRGCCMLFWYIAGISYLQRVGRELALVDSVLFDEPQELARPGT